MYKKKAVYCESVYCEEEGKMEKKKRWGIVLISSFCMVFVLYLIYFIKGVFPFGTNDISYYDMSQYCIPVYYHIYDAMHGIKSLFFDWYSGAGGSMVDHLGTFMLNPLNLLFYFIPRNQIVNMVSVFLVIKVAFSAGAMTFYSASKYKEIKPFWHVIVGVLYASSGYFIQYYSLIHYLDIIAVFPLVIWAYEGLILKKKVLPYVLIMSYCFISNLYLSGLFCPFLIFYGVVLVKSIKEREESRKVAWRIAIYTIAAILISGIVSVPTYELLLNSSRNGVAADDTYFDALLMMFTEEDGQKSFMLYCSELPIAMIGIYCLKRGKQGIKEISGKLFLLITLLLPIWIESTNYLLHFIGYVMFPMRFGYVLTFFSLALMEDIICKSQDDKSVGNEDKNTHIQNMNDGKKKITDFCFLGNISIVLVPFSVIILFLFADCFTDFGIPDVKDYSSYFLCFVLLVSVYAFSLFSKRKNTMNFVILCMVSCQVLIGWYGFLAPESDYYPETNERIIYASEEIRAVGNFERKELDRIKDRTVLLSSNYPFIMETSSMANWFWGTNNHIHSSMERMGYSTSYTRINDTGGTLYTDMLLNIKEVITQEEPDAELYTVYDKAGDFYLSKMNYEYPFAIHVNEDFTELDGISEADGLEYQNELFKSMTGIDKELISVFSDSDYLLSTEGDGSSGYLNNYSIYADGKVLLYLEPSELFDNVISIKVNDQFVDIPSIEDTHNKLYPASFNNGIIECGLFDNETINISVYFSEKKIDDDFLIGLFHLDILEESVVQLSDEKCHYEAFKNGLRIEKNITENGYVFLPVGYHSNWTITVNEKKVDFKGVLDDSFVCVPVEPGMNVIELRFCPSGFSIGAVMSIVGILISVFAFVWRDKIEKIDIITRIAKSSLYGVAAAILLMAYIIPILVYFVLVLSGKGTVI